VWWHITHYTVISKASLLTIKAPECEAVPLFLSHFEFHNVWNFGSTPTQIFTVHIISTRIALFLPNIIAQLLTILSFHFQDWLSSLHLTCFFSIFPGKLGFNNFKISLQYFFPQPILKRSCYTISHSILCKLCFTNSAENGLGSLNKNYMT
jgi:hypothetical protein